MRVGLIGCGGIARDGYIPALCFLKPTIVALYDADPAATERAARLLNEGGVVAEIHESVESVYNSVDRTIVAVPPINLCAVMNRIVETVSEHIPGTPVLVEKPMGVSAAQATEVLSIKSKGVPVSYMETFLHSNAYGVLLDELKSLRYGEIHSLRLAVGGSMPRDLDVSWRGDRARGGEALHDRGVHSFGLAIHLASAISAAPKAPANLDIEVISAEWKSVDGRDVLTECSMDIHGFSFPVNIVATWHPPITPTPALIVVCEKGSIGLVVRKTDGTSDWVCFDDPEGRQVHLACRRYPKELFVRGLDRFPRADDDSVSGLFSPHLGLLALQLADRSYELARAMRMTRSR